MRADALNEHVCARAKQPPACRVVVPVRNEAGNIAPLVAEIAAALARHGSFEIIYVNDGSTDAHRSRTDAA